MLHTALFVDLPISVSTASLVSVVSCVLCSNGRIDRSELKVLLESVEGGLAYPLLVAEVRALDPSSTAH